jgi:hypothetical protein
MNLSSIYAYLDGNDEDLQKVMAGSADRKAPNTLKSWGPVGRGGWI